MHCKWEGLNQICALALFCLANSLFSPAQPFLVRLGITPISPHNTKMGGKSTTSEHPCIKLTIIHHFYRSVYVQLQFSHLFSAEHNNLRQQHKLIKCITEIGDGPTINILGLVCIITPHTS